MIEFECNEKKEGRVEGRIKGYEDDISSQKIVSFTYQSRAFQIECNINKMNHIDVKVQGGIYEERDGRAFRLNYTSNNYDLLLKIQKIIETYKISYNNGYILMIKNRPEEMKNTISVVYDTDEKIFKSSNLINIIPQKAIKELYDLFHEDAMKNKLDFTKEKSTSTIFDDATEKYLQGKWKGTHNEKEYIVIFSGTNVKIFCDRELLEDIDYIIIRGNVRKNQKKKNIAVPSSEYDFEELKGISYFKKKTDYVLIAYFKEDNFTTTQMKRVYD